MIVAFTFFLSRNSVKQFFSSKYEEERLKKKNGIDKIICWAWLPRYYWRFCYTFQETPIFQQFQRHWRVLN